MSKNQAQTLVTSASFTSEAAFVYLMTPGLNGREGIPACIWGEPGNGKSTITRSLAQTYGFHVETVILGQREPSEVCGTQIPHKLDSGEIVIVYAKPKWVRTVNALAERGVPCLVFFDELSTCPPNTQAPALRIINEGNGGDWSLDRSIRFMCAANPPECSAGGQELSPPMANRMGHFTSKAALGAEFSSWLMSNGGDKYHLNYNNSENEQTEGLRRYAAAKKKIADNWDKEFAAARATVARFTENNPDQLQNMPNVDSSDAGRAWPSPRTWEAASRLFATCKCLGSDPSTITKVIASIVGDTAAVEFIQYSTSFDLPDLMAILNGDLAYRVTPSKADIAFIVLQGLISVAEALQTRGLLKQHQKENMWKFLDTDGASSMGDIQLRALSRVIQTENPLGDAKIAACKSCLKKSHEVSMIMAKYRTSK